MSSLGLDHAGFEDQSKGFGVFLKHKEKTQNSSKQKRDII